MITYYSLCVGFHFDTMTMMFCERVCLWAGGGVGVGGTWGWGGKQRLGPHDNGVKSIVTVGSSFASLCDLM